MYLVPVLYDVLRTRRTVGGLRIISVAIFALMMIRDLCFYLQFERERRWCGVIIQRSSFLLQMYD